LLVILIILNAYNYNNKHNNKYNMLATSIINNRKIKTDLDKWINSTKKNNICFIGCDNDNNKLQFQINYQDFFWIIYPPNYPKKSDSIFFVEYNELELETNNRWVAQLNDYIIEHNPQFGRLLRHINKENNKNIKNNINIDTNIDINIDININIDIDIEEALIKKKLEESLTKNKSNITNVDTNNSIKKLFDNNSPGTILISQYMELYKYYKNSNTIKLDLYDNNIYNWKLQFRNFNNNKQDEFNILMKKYNYDHIELEIKFHDSLYPTYPPFIKIVRPRLNNSLMHRITNLQMIQLEYWTPARTTKYVIEKLYSILEQHVDIDIDTDMNDIDRYPNGAYHKLELPLIKLASMCGVEDNFTPLDNTEYKKIYNITTDSIVTATKTKHWSSGTGYGSGDSKWDYEKYIKLQEEKDNQIKSILQFIITNMESSFNNINNKNNTSNKNILEYNKILESSYLIPFIVSQLRGNTILEISKHREMYKLIFVLLQHLVTESSIHLFINKDLFKIIEDLNKEASQVIKLSTKTSNTLERSGGQDDELVDSYTICSLYEMILPLYNSYFEKMKLEKNIISTNTNINNNNNIYCEQMNSEVYNMVNFVNNKYKYYSYTQTSASSQLTRRLARDIASLNNTLPISFQSSILLRVDDKDMRCMRVLITGPDSTPYDSGIFIFDVFCGTVGAGVYPNVPPLMNIINQSNKRFNPNLYAEGKVCLSLLGTWGNNKGGEGWIPGVSTLNQLFVSIQSLILIDNPLFNEPGHESTINTQKGITNTKNYNQYIRYYTMCHAVYDMVNNLNAYLEFKDAIIKHFRIKKDYILETYKKWVDESYSLGLSVQHSGELTKKMFEDKYNEIKEIFAKLE
jgi:baculoviral IAP repeat-containing protein 6